MLEDPTGDQTRELFALAVADKAPEVQALERALQVAPTRAAILAQLESCEPNDLCEAIPSDRHLQTALQRLAQLLQAPADQPIVSDNLALDDCLLTVLADRSPTALQQRAELAMLHLRPTLPLTQHASPSAPRIIGRFALGKPLGSGSSGVVFRARHLDNGKAAALKLLRLDSVSTEQVRRFRNEARIASSLDHPGVVRVIDSGVHEDGSLTMPWIACELIEGQTLHKYLDKRERSEILLLFVSVCDAMAHAHERGVVHRDLKPQNVLIDHDGQAHVVDFGIAKLLDNTHGPTTKSGLLMGTPGYMAPEIAQRGTIAASAASDVWALGAMLFEVLCGTTPHDLRGLSQPEVLRRIAEAPTSRVESLAPTTPRDLAAIVATATAPEPERRYGSAGALRDDLQRHLAGQRVLARSPSIWEDTRRFVQRHRTTTYVVTIAVIAILTMGTIATVQWVRARAAEKQQAASADQARAASLRSLEAFSTATKFASELAESTAASDRLLGLMNAPLALLAESRSHALPDDRNRMLRMEADLRSIAGDVALRRLQLDNVEIHRVRVLEIEHELAHGMQPPPSSLADAQVRLGDLKAQRGQLDQGLAHYQAAHTIYKQRAAAAPSEIAALDDLSWSLERCSNLLARTGSGERALAMANERLAIAQQLLARQRSAATLHGYATAITFYLEMASRTQLHTAPELELATQAAESIDAALDLDPDRRTYRIRSVHAWQLAATHADLAGDRPAAQAAMGTATQRVEALLAVDAQDHDYVLVAAQVARQHAELLTKWRSWPAADRLFEHAMTLAAQLKEDSPSQCPTILGICDRAHDAALAGQDPASIARWSARYEQLLLRHCDGSNPNWHARQRLASLELRTDAKGLHKPASGRARLVALVTDLATADPRDTPGASFVASMIKTMRGYLPQQECDQLIAKLTGK